MNVIRKTCMVLFTLLSIVGKCYAQEGDLYSSKPKFTSDFVKAINSSQYLLAAMQVDRFNLELTADSIDSQINFTNFYAFIDYVDANNLVSDETFYQLWAYVAKANLRAAKVVFYNHKDLILAQNFVDEAINIYSQLDEEKYGIDYASSNCIKGEILLALGDTTGARDILKKAVTQYKKYNANGEDYIECLFYWGISYSNCSSYKDSCACEPSMIWDECYYALVDAKEKELIPNDFFLSEENVLRYAISSYVRCGLKHKWIYEFDEAEDAFLTAIERNNQRNKYTSEPIESLGNLEQYLLDCRKLRAEVAHYTVQNDIFQGDTTCELCTPFQLLVTAISNASYYHEINDARMFINSLRKAHDLITMVDSLPIATEITYHNLCLSISKDSIVKSFMDKHDIDKSINFLYKQYPTLIDSIRIELTYAGSLIPYQMSSARVILDRVTQLISINEKELIQSTFFPHLQLLYLISLINYDIAKTNQMLTNPNILQDFLYNDALIAKDVALISSMWSELKADSVFVENIDVQTQVPAMILMLSSFFSDDEQYCEKWAIDYLAWRKQYLSKYISIIPELKRDLWLDNDGLKAENAIYKHIDVLDRNDLYRYDSIVGALYDNELLRNEILFKSSLSVKQYLNDSADLVASVLFEDLQQKKKRSVAYRQKGQNDVLLMDSIAQAERVLSETTREYRTQKIFDGAPTWKSIRLSLQENEVAIEFVSYGEIDSYGAFVIRKSMLHPIWIPLKNPFFITQSIDELRPYFQKRANGDNYGYYYMLPDSEKKNAYEVFYDAIWQPLSEYINEGDVVYYAPKGMLHYFSLQSVMDADSIYLMDKYNLKMVTSTGNIVEADRTPKTNNRIALYGGIYYDETSTNQVVSNDRGRIGYLPYSKKEVISISSLCRASQWECLEYTGSEATERSIEFLPEKDCSILHFATHNYCVPERDVSLATLDRVGLCLYNANSTLLNPDTLTNPSCDGILMASEVSTIDLSHTDLVVLSACNSGLGDITPDGIAGLQRGFKMAGVNSIMMSLWSVDDAATYLLMTEFYRNYLGGKTKTESLRNAQRYLRNYEQDGEKIFADPKYWAAFVLLDALD